MSIDQPTYSTWRVLPVLELSPGSLMTQPFSSLLGLCLKMSGKGKDAAFLDAFILSPQNHLPSRVPSVHSWLLETPGDTSPLQPVWSSGFRVIHATEYSVACMSGRLQEGGGSPCFKYDLKAMISLHSLVVSHYRQQGWG